MRRNFSAHPAIIKPHKKFGQQTHENSGGYGAFPNTLNPVGENEPQDTGDDYQCDIKYDFHISEADRSNLADGQTQSLAGKSDHIGNYLQTDSDSNYNNTDAADDPAFPVGVAMDKLQNPRWQNLSDNRR